MSIKIMPFSIEHQSDVWKIAEEEVGKNFIGNNYLNFFLNNKNAKGIIVKVNNEIAGFSFYQWCTREELLQHIFTGKQWLLSITANTEIIGYRNLTAVKKKFQNKGIGKKLVELSVSELKKRTHIIANVVWVSAPKKNLGRTLETLGFVPLKTIPHYWKKDSIKRKYECAVCGKPPCLCTAVIYLTGKF